MSIWKLNVEKKNFETLATNKSVDVLIIGGGMTGLQTAYYLRNKGDVCVVDAGSIGHGVTLNSTAKINYFQECIYTDIKGARGIEHAKMYLKSQREAIELIKKIIESENISCGFEKRKSFVFASSESEVIKLEQEVEFLEENNVPVREEKLPIKANSYKAYVVDDTYIFNPIKYLYGLSDVLINSGVKIYENTKIVKIESCDGEYLCHTDKSIIRAKRVVLASHYPYFLIPFLAPIKCSLERSYIIVSKAKEDKEFTCITTNNPTFSLRYHVDDEVYQISLAKSSDLCKNQDDGYYFKRVQEIFGLKDEDIVMKYTNSDMMTPDHMPYIGELKPNLYIGNGYNTWGMTNSTLAAKMISDEILGIENEYRTYFSPIRITLKGMAKVPSYMFTNTKSYLGSKLNKNKKWYSQNVEFLSIDGKPIARYTDEEGKVHTVINRCPHLGCGLTFNETEKTWDCPCHSSRFDIDGKCIKGPSNYDISYDK